MATEENKAAEAISDSAPVTWGILKYYHTKLKAAFVKQEAGKGLSTNDLTDELLQKIGTGGEPSGETVTKEEIDQLFADEEATGETPQETESLDNPADDSF